MRDILVLFLFGGVALVAVASGLAFVVFGNRAIGRHYDENARKLALVLAAGGEGLRFAEDDVRSRTTWRAPFAIGVRWPFVDVRITGRALYLVQFHRLPAILGRGRMGQPVLAMAGRSGLVREALPFVSVASLTAPPRVERDAVVLEGRLGVQSFTMKIFVRDPRAMLAALAT